MLNVLFDDPARQRELELELEQSRESVGGEEDESGNTEVIDEDDD